MPRTWLIALGAGLVSAVVFVSASTGPLEMRAVLFALTPLAIALAGLGWGWTAGAIAGFAGTILIGLLTQQLTLGVVYALSQALPMATLVYLAGLSRPVGEASGSEARAPESKDAREWYPPGRLILWACGFAAVIAAGLLLVLGGADPDFISELRSKLGETIKANLPQVTGGKELSDKDIETITGFAIAMMPGAGAFAIGGSLVFSLWLAGRVTKASGQLERSWPDLAAIAYPTGTALVLALALASVLLGLGQPFSIISSAIIGSLMLAYLLLGLAIIHYTTRATSWRPFALWALYIGVLFIQGVAFFVIVLGLFESVLRLRDKFGGPPGAKPTLPNND